MSKEIFERIKKLLDDNNIKFEVFEHEPVYTSEQAAKVREKITGLKREEALKRGAKAMIVKDGFGYYQLVTSAIKKIDFNKVKNVLGVRVKLATPEEVEVVTDCVIGSVPPFGNLFNLPVYCDKSLKENKIIDFNAGELTTSMIMNYKDWEKVVNPKIVDFAKA